MCFRIMVQSKSRAINRLGPGVSEIAREGPAGCEDGRRGPEVENKTPMMPQTRGDVPQKYLLGNPVLKVAEQLKESLLLQV
mmetsp:Transcript_4207/g.8408  ORF Transcript_4207/g.8408 Transcript_4207/m.8408 type:complete len:81 (-) Transcript_4207:144-386(-)